MNNKKIFLLFICMFFSGLFIRGLSGNGLVLANLIYAPGKKEKPPGTNTPVDTVKSFYMYIDAGSYMKAWEISLEPDLRDNLAQPGYRDEVDGKQGPFPGWTPEETFVARLRDELGTHGYGISLKNVEARMLSAKEGGGYGSGSKFAFADLTDVLPSEETYLIKVKGQMLGACSIYTWEKNVVVLLVDGKYRLLLEGTKEKDSYFYQSWFSNLKRQAYLRG